MLKLNLKFLFLFFVLNYTNIFADEINNLKISKEEKKIDEEQIDIEFYIKEFYDENRILNQQIIENSYITTKNLNILLPFLNIFLPAIDQFYRSDKTFILYSLVSFGGLSMKYYSRYSYMYEYKNSMPFTFEQYISDMPQKIKKANYISKIGDQLYDTTGYISAYDSFQYYLDHAKRLGYFKFIKEKHPTKNIMLAPFRFDFLTSPYTFLTLGSTISILAFQGYIYDQLNFTKSDDFGYISKKFLESYLSSVGEEALFRGVLLPYFYEIFKNKFFANFVNSIIFASLHKISLIENYNGSINIIEQVSNDMNIQQFLLGFAAGYITMKNKWKISESIFIHTWYNFAVYMFSSMESQGSLNMIRENPIKFPIFRWSF